MEGRSCIIKLVEMLYRTRGGLLQLHHLTRRSSDEGKKNCVHFVGELAAELFNIVPGDATTVFTLLDGGGESCWTAGGG